MNYSYQSVAIACDHRITRASRNKPRTAATSMSFVFLCHAIYSLQSTRTC